MHTDTLEPGTPKAHKYWGEYQARGRVCDMEILAHACVSGSAIDIVSQTVASILDETPESIISSMCYHGCCLAIVARNQSVTDIPEHTKASVYSGAATKVHSAPAAPCRRGCVASTDACTRTVRTPMLLVPVDAHEYVWTAPCSVAHHALMGRAAETPWRPDCCARERVYCRQRDARSSCGRALSLLRPVDHWSEPPS